MNKFVLAFAFVAVVGTVASANESRIGAFLKPGTEAEIAGLKPEYKGFEDFCLDTRQKVYDYLNKKASHGVTFLFDTFHEGMTESAAAIGAKASEAVEEGTEKINNNAVMISEALMNIANAILDQGKKEARDIIADAANGLKPENFVTRIEDTCEGVKKFVRDNVSKSFTSAQKALARSAAPEDRKVIMDAKFGNLGCLTVGRLNKVSGGCELVNALMPFLKRYV